jgi:hypothetical protein
LGECPLQRILIYFCLFVGAFFARNALESEINNIEQKHHDLFANEIKPYKVDEDYNFVPNGRGGEFEDNSKVYYTEEDQKILDERDRILGPLPYLSILCFILTIGGAIVFSVLLYSKITDVTEKRQEKIGKIKGEALQKAHQEKITQINQDFIKKVETIIRSHETSGTAMSHQEMLTLLAEMNNTINSYSIKVKLEYTIKQHMKIHNPS